MSRRSTLGKFLSGSAIAVVCLALAGCGDGLSGHKYTEKGSKDGIEFKSGNKAYLTVMGTTMETKYAVDGDKILLDSPQGEGGKLVLTRAKDGTITGLPMTGPLTKQE